MRSAIYKSTPAPIASVLLQSVSFLSLSPAPKTKNGAENFIFYPLFCLITVDGAECCYDG